MGLAALSAPLEIADAKPTSGIPHRYFTSTAEHLRMKQVPAHDSVHRQMHLPFRCLTGCVRYCFRYLVVQHSISCKIPVILLYFVFYVVKDLQCSSEPCRSASGCLLFPDKTIFVLHASALAVSCILKIAVFL